MWMIFRWGMSAVAGLAPGGGREQGADGAHNLIEHGVALAGTDPVAVDSIGAGLMGIDVNNIGYLKFCADAGIGSLDRSNIEILGGKDPAQYVRKYQLHERIEQQLEWKGEMKL